jgi:hypothetical protein
MLLYIVYMVGSSRPEKMIGNCGKVAHMGMMDSGVTVHETQFKSKFRNLVNQPNDSGTLSVHL